MTCERKSEVTVTGVHDKEDLKPKLHYTCECVLCICVYGRRGEETDHGGAESSLLVSSGGVVVSSSEWSFVITRNSKCKHQQTRLLAANHLHLQLLRFFTASRTRSWKRGDQEGFGETGLELVPTTGKALVTARASSQPSCVITF